VIRRDPRAGGSLARGISGPGPRDSNRLQISQSVIKRLPPQTTKKTMKTKPLQAERQPGPERCPRNIRSEPFDVLLVLDIDFLMFDQIVKLGLNTINFAICPGREYRPKASVMSSLAFGVLCHIDVSCDLVVTNLLLESSNTERSLPGNRKQHLGIRTIGSSRLMTGSPSGGTYSGCSGSRAASLLARVLAALICPRRSASF
jgi:hypothetical protein